MGGRPRAIDQHLNAVSVGTSPRKYAVVSVKKPRDVWRAALREVVGADGARLWKTLLDIAEGRTWKPTLEDGREGPPQIPTTKDRLQAVEYLANTLFGRPVDQTQIVHAEKAASENAALQALSDAELLLEARRVVELAADAGKDGIVDATVVEAVPEPVDE